MNPWEKVRNKSGWKHGGYLEWTESKKAFISVVFTYLLPQAYERSIWYRTLGYQVFAGGPAVDLNPNYLNEVADCSLHIPTLHKHNPRACFTTRGCIRKCPFCAVPIIEGKFKELDDFQLKPIVCDNNFLASSRKHFDQVIGGLKRFKNVDFNQGLDHRLLTQYRAERISELNLRCVRLAWDYVQYEREFMRAFELLRKVGIPASKIRSFVLIGFQDTPQDALYRLQKIRELGAWPNPMRYQPLDIIKKNSHVGEHWTDSELKRYMRYWSNLRYTNAIPFEDFDRKKYIKPASKKQLDLI